MFMLQMTVFRCVICMGEFKIGDALRFLPCVHIYHKECIDDWLMRSFTCPSCMEPVDAAILTTYEWSTIQTNHLSFSVLQFLRQRQPNFSELSSKDSICSRWWMMQFAAFSTLTVSICCQGSKNCLHLHPSTCGWGARGEWDLYHSQIGHVIGQDRHVTTHQQYASTFLAVILVRVNRHVENELWFNIDLLGSQHIVWSGF